MSTATATTATAASVRMRPRTRKAVLTVHILAAGAWIGLDVALGVLVFTALLATDPAAVALALQALPMVLAPLLTTGLLTLLSGVLLGLGTHLGLLRYWWVAVKLAINTVLVTLVWFVLRPGLESAAAQGRLLAAGQPATESFASMVFPPLVSGTALVVATLLAVYRPWGRISRRTR